MYASQAQHHRVATPARCTRCDGSPPSPLHLAIIRNEFLMMFPPAATWTRAVGLRGLIGNIKGVFWHFLVRKTVHEVGTCMRWPDTLLLWFAKVLRKSKLSEPSTHMRSLYKNISITTKNKSYFIKLVKYKPYRRLNLVKIPERL